MLSSGCTDILKGFDRSVAEYKFMNESSERL